MSQRSLVVGVSRVLAFVAFFFAAVVVVVLPLFSQTGSGSPAANSVALLLAFSLGALTIYQAIKGRLSVPRTSINWAMLAFALTVLISLFVASYRRAALVQAQDFLGYVVLFFVLLVLYEKSGAVGRLFLYLLLATTAVSVAVGFQQRLWGFGDMLSQVRLAPEPIMRQLGISPESWPDFVSRLETREVYSTFTLSNSFAGFLILMLPVTLAILWQRLHLQDGFKRVLAGLPLVLLLAGGVVCLYWTGSKGAWASLVLAGLLAPMVGVGLGLKRRYKVIGLTLAVAVLLGGVGFYFVRPQAFLPGGTLESMGVRVGYWQGGWELVKKQPLLGVGLGGFGDKYLWYKSAAAREVQSAHNNFVQVLAEMGIVGLVSFLSIWATFFWGLGKCVAPRRNHNYLRARQPGSADTSAVSVGQQSRMLHLLAMFSGPVGLFLLWGLRELDDNWLMPVSLIWVVFYGAVSWSDGEGRPLPDTGVLRWGLAVGVMAFLVHSLVDMDLYVPGIAGVVVVMLAFLACGQTSGERTAWQWRPAGVGKAAICGCALAAVLIFGWLVYRPLTLSMGLKNAADIGHPQAAIEKLEQARKLLPGDAEVYEMLAALYLRQGRLGKAEQAYKRVIELRPASFSGYQSLAAFYGELAGKDANKLRLATDYLRKAIARYPTLPDMHIEMGELLARQGQNQQAIVEYREAVTLAAQATQRTRKFSRQREQEIHAIIEKLEKGKLEGDSEAAVEGRPGSA